MKDKNKILIVIGIIILIIFIYHANQPKEIKNLGCSSDNKGVVYTDKIVNCDENYICENGACVTKYHGTEFRSGGGSVNSIIITEKGTYKILITGEF